MIVTYRIRTDKHPDRPYWYALSGTGMTAWVADEKKAMTFEDHGLALRTSNKLRKRHRLECYAEPVPSKAANF